MWRPSFMRRAHVLRLCRDRVELWSNARNGLALLATQAIGSDQRGASPLAISIETLLGNASAAGKGETFDVEVVAESAWLAVLPLVTGNALWSAATMEALVRHRLEQTYADEINDVARWDIRIEHRPGDAHAVGFAMDPAIKAAIVQAVSGLGHRLRSIQPAFSWSWQRLRSQRRSIVRANGHGKSLWISMESDRALAAVISAGQVIALNPAATLPANDAELSRLAAKEAFRLGIDVPEPQVVAVSWVPGAAAHRPGLDQRTNWLSLAEHPLAQSKAIDASTAARRTAS